MKLKAGLISLSLNLKTLNNQQEKREKFKVPLTWGSGNSSPTQIWPTAYFCIL